MIDTENRSIVARGRSGVGVDKMGEEACFEKVGTFPELEFVPTQNLVLKPPSRLLIISKQVYNLEQWKK